MTGFGNSGKYKQSKKKDSEIADTSASDSEELDEFGDTGEFDADFESGKMVGLDSVEIDVEEILSEIASEVNTGDTASVRVRKQLEAMMERKREQEELIDFDEYDLD